MKDQDIKLPKIDDAILSDSSGIWLSILEWYKATVDKPSLSWEMQARRVDDEVKKLMTEYAREAVRMNQPIASNNQPLPFDLEAAKRGEAIVTRDGRKARFVAYVPEAKDYKVIAYIDGEEIIETFTDKGIFLLGSDIERGRHLFMAPKPKRVVYFNIYNNGHAAVHSSELSARKAANAGAEIIAHPVELP